MKGMSLICPICRETLFSDGKRFFCTKGHSFDIARQGYVNLLMRGGTHGDDCVMTEARTKFLEKGYYSGLREEIYRAVISAVEEASLRKENILMLDAGCGDLWYGSYIWEGLRSDLKSRTKLLGIDISKDAIKKACSKRTGAVLAVASLAELPLSDSCLDVFLNVFAPLYYDEAMRVLDEDGCIVKVTPLSKHLLSLKQTLYEDVRLKDEERETYPDLVCSFESEYYEEITVAAEDKRYLFEMTPYYYKTSREDRAKLEEAVPLRTEIHCRIAVYRRKRA